MENKDKILANHESDNETTKIIGRLQFLKGLSSDIERLKARIESTIGTPKEDESLINELGELVMVRDDIMDGLREMLGSEIPENYNVVTTPIIQTATSLENPNGFETLTYQDFALSRPTTTTGRYFANKTIGAVKLLEKAESPEEIDKIIKRLANLAEKYPTAPDFNVKKTQKLRQEIWEEIREAALCFQGNVSNSDAISKHLAQLSKEIIDQGAEELENLPGSANNDIDPENIN